MSDPSGGEAGEEGQTVDLEAVGPLARPVTLAEMKGNGVFAGFEWLRLPRLSVLPVPPAIRRAVLDLARR